MAVSGIISTVVVSLILLSVVVLIIRHLRKKKKDGIGTCGCDCAHCAMSCGHDDNSPN